MHPNTLNQQNDVISGARDAKVLIFPARTPKISGKQLFFLFSMFQVEDIVRDVTVQPVPFSQDYADGIALWRNRVAPVLSLEKCLGLQPDISSQNSRYILIRSVEDSRYQKRCLIRTLSAIRMMVLPKRCRPVPFYHLVSDPVLVRGLYEWERSFLLVVHMENILKGRLYYE